MVGLSGVSERLGVFGWLVRSRLAWFAVVGAVFMAVAALVLDALGAGSLVALAVVPDVVGFSGIGCLLLARRPGHPMGPLLCLIGLTSAIDDVAVTYARYVLVHPPGSLPFPTALVWANAWIYAPAVSLGGLVLPLVFPDGRLLSRRWRPALWAALAFIPLVVVGAGFVSRRMGGYLGSRPNPYAVSWAAPLRDLLWALALTCAVAAGVAAAASLVVRWRRADRVGRQQLKWFLAVMPMMAATLVINGFVMSPVGLLGSVGVALGSVTGVLLPVAIGVAVLRYRLYEIDVLLNRAVLYGSLTAVVVVAYLAVAGVATFAFAGNRGLAAQVLAAVLAAAALWPLRDRVQGWVNGQFYGDHSVPHKAVLRLGRSVQEADTQSALDAVVHAIADTLRLEYVALQMRLGDQWRLAAVYDSGDSRSLPMAFALVSQRETVGRLLVGMRSPGERLDVHEELLLADLARQVGPAIHAVALRQALGESRARLVSAREEERRRLRRDLHDGLGPTLAGLTLGLDAALARCDGRPDLRDLLARLKTETQRAVADVRRTVYGLRPPALDELGLAGSLREHIERLREATPALAVHLEVPGSMELPAAVEVACYRIATEALTNVARHADAACCTVRLWRDRGMRLLVQDDGIGLPDGWRAGVGIASMRERVAELDGDLQIEPCPPHGTRIAARLPLGESG